MAGTITRGKIIRADLALWDGKTATHSRIDATGGTVTGLKLGNEVDVLQLYGSGTSRTRGSIADAVQQIGSSNVTLVFAPGTWTIDATLTIPSNFTCHVPAGCVFSADSGVTLTFSGDVHVEDPESWYSGSGTVVVSREGNHGGVWHRTSEERAASVTPSDFSYPPLDARRYGYVPDDSTNNATALTNAIAVATQYGGADIILPGGTGRFTSDVTLTQGNSFVGCGYGTVLHCVGCSLIVDAATANTTVEWCSLRQMALKRTGSAGPVIDLISDHVASANDFVANIVFDRVRILESTGDGLRIRGIVGADFYSLQVEDCAAKGVRIEGNSANSDVNNAIRFHGGNILRNDVGVWMVSAQNVLAMGTVVEANTSGGWDITRNCHQIVLLNTWQENNGGFDVRVGVDTASGNSHNIRIIGCNFVDGAAAKADSIELIISQETFIDNCSFNGYGTEAIDNNPSSNGSVTGHIGNHNELVNSTPSLCTGETVDFYRHTHARGSFTGTLTGVDSAVTGTLIYDMNGKTVTLHIPQLSGTSNATTKTITGAPSAITPTVQQYFPVRVSDNGGNSVWGTGRVETTGVISLFPLAAGGNWTASGTMTMNAITLTWYLP